MNEIFNRASVRRFQGEKVEAEKIEKLMRAAMAAPSAGNQQPWEFVVVEKPETLAALASVSPYARCVQEAPLAIVPLGNQQRMHFPENWQMDLSACAENILLEAVSLGLGAVWMSVAPQEERMQAASKVLGLPKHVLPFAVIACGYPRGEFEAQDRYDASRVHYEQY